MLNSETPMGRLTSVGYDWLYRQKIEPLNDTVDRFLALTTEDVDAVLQQRPFDTLTLVGIGPLAEAS